MAFVHIIVVGAGGTGGELLSKLGRFLASYKGGKSWHLTIIDGDRVEEKNLERQPFIMEDVMVNKALAMKEALCDVYGVDRKKISVYDKYLLNVNELQNIVDACQQSIYTRDITYYIVGCVDNHRARQVLHEFFYQSPSIIYDDLGNEFDRGESVRGVRLKGINLAPPRGYYYPEVLRDKSPRADELSCGVVNTSAPQHICTNMYAAVLGLSAICRFFSEDKIEGGQAIFKTFTNECFWQPFTGKCPSEDQVMEYDEFF